jgi:hypothetical protein
MLCGACSFSVRCGSDSGILAGQEITISYGSNKSNLALLSCYGFQIPGNPNDAQLLAPIFQLCLGVAGDSKGFPVQLLQHAAQSVEALQQQQQQQGDSGSGHGLLQPTLVAARRACALAALPTDATTPYSPMQQQQQQQQDRQQLQQEMGKPDSNAALRQVLQQQRHLSHMMLYQLGLMSKRCGTSVSDDFVCLSEAQAHAAAAAAAAAVTAASEPAAVCADASTGSSTAAPGYDSSSTSATWLDLAIQEQALLARLEQKLLMQECEQILSQVLVLIEADLQAAAAQP